MLFGSRRARRIHEVHEGKSLSGILYGKGFPVLPLLRVRPILFRFESPQRCFSRSVFFVHLPCSFVLLSRIFLFFEQDFVYKLLFSQRSLRLCGELLFVFWLRLCCSRFSVTLAGLPDRSKL